jgi:hypothetical protein
MLMLCNQPCSAAPFQMSRVASVERGSASQRIQAAQRPPSLVLAAAAPATRVSRLCPGSSVFVFYPDSILFTDNSQHSGGNSPRPVSLLTNSPEPAKVENLHTSSCTPQTSNMHGMSYHKLRQSLRQTLLQVAFLAGYNLLHPVQGSLTP